MGFGVGYAISYATSFAASALGFSAAAASSVGFFAATTGLNLAAGLLLTAASNALSGRGQPQQQDVKRSLRFASARPQYRFVYGQTRVPGSEIPSPVVGSIFYAAYLLNSRPSVMTTHTVLIDGRPVAFSGDPFDFSGSGAVATNSPFAGYVNYWIGRGDQTAPPAAFTNQAGFGNPVVSGDNPHDGTDELLWRTTDAGQGCTILFLRMASGPSEERLQRWPTPIPSIDVDSDWTPVWDPRNGSQSLGNPATWGFSANAALCALDSLTQNPFRPHGIEFLDVDQWIAAANVADQSVALAAGGAHPRYHVGGLVTFGNGEIEQIVQPLLSAQAAQFVRVGGKLGIAPGIAKNVATTVRDSLGGLGYSRFGENAATEIRASYSSNARGGEAAELPPWPVPGAPVPVTGLPDVLSLDLGLVPNAQQAQRVRNIAGRREAKQAQIEMVAPASALDLLPGSWITVELPSPYDRFDATYEVQSSHPMMDPVGEQGAAMRCALTLREIASSVYAWDPATDEEPVDDPSFSYERAGVAQPGAITATTGPSVDLDTGSGIITRIRFEADPSTSAGVSSYEWQYRVYDAAAGAGDNWLSGGTIATSTVDAEGDIFAFLSGVNPALNYDIRVRAVSAIGASDWRVASDIDFNFGLTSVTASAPSAGVASFSFTTPNVNALGGVRIWRGATGSAFDSATILVASEPVDQDASDTAQATGVTAGAADFWIAPVTTGGSVGDVSGPFTLTIT